MQLEAVLLAAWSAQAVAEKVALDAWHRQLSSASAVSAAVEAAAATSLAAVHAQLHLLLRPLQQPPRVQRPRVLLQPVSAALHPPCLQAQCTRRRLRAR